MSLPPLGGGSGAQTQASLPALPAHLQSDTQLTAHLASRFHAGSPTARLSSHALVSINNYSSSAKGIDGGREGSAMAGAEEMADRAWLRLGHRSENQAVGRIWLGQIHPSKPLVDLAAQQDFHPLSTKLSLAAYVFDTLTTTKTSTTPTASKAGLFYELQYDTATSTNPILLGGKLLDHRLERSRIADVPTGERNFHVLYYLLAGTTAAEKAHLGFDTHGNTQKRWRYLGHPTQLKVGINDAEGFTLFKNALRKLEFPRSEIAEMCQVLASILHIGQLEFETTSDTTVTGDDSGGFSHEGGQTITAVKNKDTLNLIAAFLGVSAGDLQTTLGYKTKMIHKERVTVMLDPEGARSHAGELARTLYSLFVAYVVESMNQKLCAPEESIANTVSIIDFPGFSQQAHTKSTLDQLLSNAACEALYNLTLQNFFDRKADMLESEEVAVSATSYFDNSDAVKGLLKSGNGLLSILDDQTRRGQPSINVGAATAKLPGSNFATENTAATFTVKHFAGEVDYPVKGLIEENSEVISGDLLSMFGRTKNDFVARLFGQEALQTVHHPKEKTTVMQATISSKPMRAPSVMSRKTTRSARPSRFERRQQQEELDALSEAGESRKGSKLQITHGASGQFLSSLENVTKAVADPTTNAYFVFCLKPNDRRISNQFDSKCVRTQVQTFGIAEISQRLRDTMLIGTERERVELVVEEKRWPSNEVKVGSTGVFLSERCWMEISQLGDTYSASGGFGPSEAGDGITPGDQVSYAASKERLLSTGTPTPMGYGEKGKSGYFGNDDTRSEAGVSAYGGGDMFKNMDTVEQMAERSNEKDMVEVEEYRDSPGRKRWVFLVYFLTWPIPDFLIKWLGKMPRKDLICPKQHVYSPAELSSFNGKKGSDGAYVSIRGYVFDLEEYASHHYPPPPVVDRKTLLNYAGLDISNLFPIQVSALCQGKDGTVDEHVTLDYKSTNISGSPLLIDSRDFNAQYHDFRAFSEGGDSRPDWYYEQMTMLREKLSGLESGKRNIAIIGSRVYDLTEYLKGGRRLVAFPDEEDPPTDLELTNFMEPDLTRLFEVRSGEDLTELWENLALSAAAKKRMMACLNNLFFVGDVDTRRSTRCLFAEYLVLAVSILLASVICFKFFAALQFGTKNVPENIDKFVMCQIPAYTEDEDSLRRAIDSAARMKYDDKRKLLVIVCDGMIIGQGNDRPTPRIVLDILGVSESVDPEALSFESLGEGLKQHNMGKVYSGLYEVQGHIVPFLVIVKVGKPSEVARPGNRGKRDSQMIIMRFLNRVHYNLPMSPLELEMYHQIRNIIGVNPTFYEFMLQIDADTVVAADSATRMVSAFLHDTRLIAVCGETALTNAKSSFITMIQVYEYYISHNLSKAFESLFGSVTCLPGCFSMYRIRAAETGKPLFVSREVVEAYSTIRVDTLHMKNLLHLGEDRYLTTLLLKFHSKYKTKYIFEAHAWTIAPDSWQVFLSQRRRWINSTVHNLMELIPMNQLCGFCCFSMRFIVFVDLLSTIVQPVTVAYIAYLIYMVADKKTVVPVTAFVLLAAIYGLQAIIFILRRKWEMIGWMILYVLAIPVFSFGLPLYSFWHMDDFNWGNTRVVAGEKGKKVVISDEGKFDPSSIPASDGRSTRRSSGSYATKANQAMSEYGYPNSRPGSTLGVYPPMPGLPVSRLSYAGSDVMGNRQSTFGGSQFFTPEDMVGLPSDDEILAEIREILRTADLMTVTKKGVKQELEKRFGVPLDAKKAYINSATEAILSGQL
ncbi:unnamed protein product [Parascedosporium putredinis]|uniref:chitin synthase n=1 Tax=Parascedosporium putredinis TaxID=1442378 RepID=A0A9P1MBK1_9PEZI|nr:unnamed protein product [Parascedosporium putredinis]CAI7998821.1 unnamed protein product [Parascedosporium putredinis]